MIAYIDPKTEIKLGQINILNGVFNSLFLFEITFLTDGLTDMFGTKNDMI